MVDPPSRACSDNVRCRSHRTCFWQRSGGPRRHVAQPPCAVPRGRRIHHRVETLMIKTQLHDDVLEIVIDNPPVNALGARVRQGLWTAIANAQTDTAVKAIVIRSEEHTSELQSLMRTSYAVLCLKNKKIIHHKIARKL